MRHRSNYTRVHQPLHGFTLIELLVVISIIALLLAVVIPSLHKAKTYSQRLICSNQLRQLVLGTQMYAQENDNYWPLNRSTGWLWDISYLTTDFLINDAGMVRQAFYCPTDRSKSADDDRLWRWTESNPDIPRTPEPTATDGRANNFRVTSYFYLFDTENGRGSSYTARRDMNPAAPVRQWPRKTTEIKNSGTWELIADAAISRGSGNRETDTFIDVQGGSYGKWGLYDNTNHVDRRMKPVGSNIAFADGHVEWRDFDRMAVWGQFGPYHWW